MDNLDKVIEVFIDSKSEIIDKNASEEERNDLLIALREKTKNEIVQEIRKHYKDEIIAEAETEMIKKNSYEKIKQMKNLMWTGFIVAFAVGLAVNQITEIIGYFKGTIIVDSITSTMILSIVFCLLCIVIYIYSFMKDFLEIIKKDKQD